MAKKITDDIFREQIIALFKKKGISQAETGRRARVSANTVCQFLNRRCGISTAKATALYRVLSAK